MHRSNRLHKLKARSAGVIVIHYQIFLSGIGTLTL